MHNIYFPALLLSIVASRPDINAKFYGKPKNLMNHMNSKVLKWLTGIVVKAGGVTIGNVYGLKSDVSRKESLRLDNDEYIVGSKVLTNKGTTCSI